ncbi:hypothetical protein [Planotetraspora silvatica]|uniref:hypothetical protein n=1 Tax=Planotetraspora silvatica TaxID=234614 RepID=UPI0031D64717
MALTYEVNGALRVTYPFASSLDASGRLERNPYYDTEGTAAVLSVIALSPDVEKVVNAAGGTAKFVTSNEGNSVISITTTDPNQAKALLTYRTLINELGVRLDDLQTQKHIPRDYWVAVDDVVQPQAAAPSYTGKLKVGLAATVLGLIISIGVCLIVDYRMRKRSGTPASSPEPSAPVTYDTVIESRTTPAAIESWESEENADFNEQFVVVQLSNPEANGARSTTGTPPGQGS